VIKRIAPEAEILDITHGIAPQNVLQGALVLAETLPFMPEGVHIAVVDPGVGGPRRPVVLRGGDGRLYVGPDNGILVEAVGRLGGIAEAVEPSRSEYRLDPVSSTFHGRDIFAPVAAHLARGVPVSRLGPPIDPSALVKLDVPRAHVEPGRIDGHVLAVDRFGNIRLNVGARDLAGAALARGETVEVEVASRCHSATVARTFADVEPGKIAVFEDSSGTVSIAVNSGNAARTLATMVGQEVSLRERRECR
jgi:S-adenosylmethionine hydrolase